MKSTMETGDGSKMGLCRRCLILHLDQDNQLDQKPLACGSILNTNMSSLIRSAVMLRDIFVKNIDFDYMVAQIYSGYHPLNIFDHKLGLSHNGI